MGRRARVRREVVRGLRALRAWLSPSGAASTGPVARGAHPASETPAPPEADAGHAPDVAPEDVILDAWTVLERQGVGVEMVLVDVRTAAERRAEGAPEGALWRPLHTLSVEDVPADVAVVFVCAAGMRSLDAAMALRALGHPSAWSLDGGVGAWRRAGGAWTRDVA
jgi:rhodanese-related sulfurtransferase